MRLLLLLVSAGLLHADLVTFDSANFGSFPNSYSGQVVSPGPNNLLPLVLVLPQFDPSLGTLNSTTLSWTMDADAPMFIVGKPGLYGTLLADYTVQATGSVGGLSASSDLISYLNQPVPYDPGCPYCFAPAQYSISDSQTISGTQGTGFLFLQPDFEFTAAMLDASQVVFGTPNVSPFASVSFDAQITYTYTTAPEPSMTLAILGLLGCLLVRQIIVLSKPVPGRNT